MFWNKQLPTAADELLLAIKKAMEDTPGKWAYTKPSGASATSWFHKDDVWVGINGFIHLKASDKNNGQFELIALSNRQVKEVKNMVEELKATLALRSLLRTE